MSKLKGRHRKLARNKAPPQQQSPSILKSLSYVKHQSVMCPNKHTTTMTSNDKPQQPGNIIKMARLNKQTLLSILVLCVVPINGLQLNNLLHQQYPRSPLSQNLVMPPTLSPSLSFHSNVVTAESQLSRQPYGQAALVADLDNVIESTVASPHLQQQPAFVGSLVPRPTPATTTHHHLHQSQAAACQLPPTWAGKWYQANKEPIRVTNTEISDKGICRDKKGDKYLFEYTKQNQQTCLYCLVINERHLNVLQYKESGCQPVPAQYQNRTINSQLIIDPEHSLLDSICSDITGDTQLESLFRLDTPPIECPISGKYQFTYDNCYEPQSSLDSCIDKKQLHFKFAACPDQPGSESKSEVLKCYADWSEGNNYYMIGRLEPASNHQDKGKFRCFVYEKLADGGYWMAQSLEESCYGLINPHEDGRPLRLTLRTPTSNKCHFPSYIRGQSENWLSVDNSLIYMFNQNSTKYQVMETKERNIIEEATCLQQFPLVPQAYPSSLQSHLQARSNANQQATTTTANNRRFPPSSYQPDQLDTSAQHQAALQSSRHNDAVYLIQITKGCYTTDYCVRFYRRTNGIVQIDYFIALPGTDDQQRCRNAYTLNTPQTQIITSTNLEEQKCPFDGAYTIEAPLESDFTYNPSNIFICPRQSFLTAQCEQPSRLRIHYKCSAAKYMIKNLKCLGSWTTNGLVRLLLADDERQRYSAWYKDYGLPIGNQPDDAQTRSQHMLVMSQTAIPSRNQLANPLANIIDLQLALITPLPIVTKPMQVRLTRRNHCSDLRSYSNHGLLSPPAGQPLSISSYASASSSSQPNSIKMFHTVGVDYYCSLVLIVPSFVSLFFYLISTRQIVSA